MARPLRLFSMLAAAQYSSHHHDQAVVVEPLVFGQRQAERHLGLVEHDALHAAGQALEPLVFQDLRHGERQREGREREVVALELERRQAEQVADDEADDRRRRQGRPVRHVEMVHQDRRRVGADGVEGAVAERDLAVEAGQQVEPEHRDRRDDHGADQEQPVVGDEVGQHRPQQRHQEGQRQQHPQQLLGGCRHVRPSSRRRGRRCRPVAR